MTVELVERADDPSKDLVGTLRRERGKSTRLARSHVEALPDWEQELVEDQNFWAHSHGAVTKILPLGEDCPDCGAREAARQ